MVGNEVFTPTVLESQVPGSVFPLARGWWRPVHQSHLCVDISMMLAYLTLSQTGALTSTATSCRTTAPHQRARTGMASATSTHWRTARSASQATASDRLECALGTCCSSLDDPLSTLRVSADVCTGVTCPAPESQCLLPGVCQPNGAGAYTCHYPSKDNDLYANALPPPTLPTFPWGSLPLLDGQYQDKVKCFEGTSVSQQPFRYLPAPFLLPPPLPPAPMVNCDANPCIAPLACNLPTVCSIDGKCISPGFSATSSACPSGACEFGE